MANQSDSEFEYDPEAFESAHAEAAKSPQLPKEKDDGSDFEMPSELVSLINTFKQPSENNYKRCKQSISQQHKRLT